MTESSNMWKQSFDTLKAFIQKKKPIKLRVYRCTSASVRLLLDMEKGEILVKNLQIIWSLANVILTSTHRNARLTLHISLGLNIVGNVGKMKVHN